MADEDSFYPNENHDLDGDGTSAYQPQMLNNQESVFVPMNGEDMDEDDNNMQQNPDFVIAQPSQDYQESPQPQRFRPPQPDEEEMQQFTNLDEIDSQRLRRKDDESQQDAEDLQNQQNLETPQQEQHPSPHDEVDTDRNEEDNKRASATVEFSSENIGLPNKKNDDNKFQEIELNNNGNENIISSSLQVEQQPEYRESSFAPGAAGPGGVAMSAGFQDEEEEELQVYINQQKPLEEIDPSQFDAKKISLICENRPKDPGAFYKIFGGPRGALKITNSDEKKGLTSEQADANRARFGENFIPKKKAPGLLKLFIEAISDQMLLLLMALAFISIILGVSFPEGGEGGLQDRILGGIEGCAIVAAVLIVGTVGAWNDFEKEKKFRELSAEADNQKVKVIRNSSNFEINNNDLVVGDIVELQNGDKVPADGVCLKAYELKTDESAMTGESDLIKKNRLAPFMLSGTVVNEGSGFMLVTAVGVQSEWGKMLKSLSQEDDSKTPLAERLEKLASLIGVVGTVFAVLTFLALFLGWFGTRLYAVIVGDTDNYFAWTDISSVVGFIVISVTVIVVAVPEGLPLAVTISLAYSVKKMLIDNNLVRHLSACETMGATTNICSDKTGTLTLNQMRVVKATMGGENYFDGLPDPALFGERYIRLLKQHISVNTTAHVSRSNDPNKEFDVTGNKTESALLIFLEKHFNIRYKIIKKKFEMAQKIINVYTFSSKKKKMTTVTKRAKGLRIYTKGASEIVLANCTRYLDKEGKVLDITEEKRQEFAGSIDSMAGKGLRTLVLAYRNIDPSEFRPGMEQDFLEKDLILQIIVGIQDPLRPEVVASIKQCVAAGIVVRMITGDNIKTACYIARDCNILDDKGEAIEGPVFREMSEEELLPRIHNIKVMARSSPTDKLRLVSILQKKREVVAVTGDGTNDGPALRKADVGLSMGLSGTEVAKEASDIVIMDDNFASIVKAVLWGRTIFENIRKFLQFQLTVNVVALLLTVLTAVTTRIINPAWLLWGTNVKVIDVHSLEPPLTAVQLLWVNLIMDTFAALALATEPPNIKILEKKPTGRTDPLISWTMWVSIFSQSIYQLFVLCLLYYFGLILRFTKTDLTMDATEAFSKNNSLVFNAFVFCQIFNEINARKINMELNIFENIHKSSMFMMIFILTCIIQAAIIDLSILPLVPRFTQSHFLDWDQWVVSIVLGFFCIPYSYIFRFFFSIIKVALDLTEESEKEAKKEEAEEDQDDLEREKILRKKDAKKEEEEE